MPELRLPRRAARARPDARMPELRRAALRARVDVRRGRAGHAAICTTTRTSAGSRPCATSIDEPGQYLAFRDGERVSVMPLAQRVDADRPQPRPPTSASTTPRSRAGTRSCAARSDRVRVLDDRCLNGTLPERRARRVARPRRRRRADRRPLPPALRRHARASAVSPADPPAAPSAVAPRGRRTDHPSAAGLRLATPSKPTGRSARARGTDIRKCDFASAAMRADALRLLVLLGALELAARSGRAAPSRRPRPRRRAPAGPTCAPLPSRRSSASRSRPHSSLTRM